MKASQALSAAACIIVSLICLSNAALASEFTGKCVAVIDGDTIEVMHDRIPERIRLSGIDCPEKSQAFGMRAKQFTSHLTFGQNVTISWGKKDRYGRTIGAVLLPDGRDVNVELVRAGYAWWYRKYSSDLHLSALERAARDRRTGLWSDPDPMPPWQYRHQSRAVRDRAPSEATSL